MNETHFFPSRRVAEAMDISGSVVPADMSCSLDEVRSRGVSHICPTSPGTSGLARSGLFDPWLPLNLVGSSPPQAASTFGAPAPP